MQLTQEELKAVMIDAFVNNKGSKLKKGGHVIVGNSEDTEYVICPARRAKTEAIFAQHFADYNRPKSITDAAKETKMDFQEVFKSLRKDLLNYQQKTTTFAPHFINNKHVSK
jgi:hypothetical protein